MAEILLYLAIILAAVTLVGHGLWLILARIFAIGADSERTRPGGPPKLQICPRCGLELEAGRCRACDWPRPLEIATKRPIAALDALDAQVERLALLGLLEPAAFRELSQWIATQRQGVSHAQRSATPAHRDLPPTDEPLAADLVDEGPTRPERFVADPVAATRTPTSHDHREFVSDVPVEARAAQFVARQGESAAANVFEPPSSPQSPGPSLTDWLGAFMEERNVRWGELVGGLLIVCCSIALVVSFWSAIAERPLVEFFLFNGVTACLFGIGFHSEHRWRLHTTSQGLLITATLLVPLNFLAIAAFSRSDAGESLLTISGGVE